MAEKNFRKKLYPDYKKKKPKKPKIHPDDIAPEVGHKEKVEGTQAVQDADMKEGKYLDTGKLDKSGNPLMIQRDPKTQQGINRDVEKNLRGDLILDPNRNFPKGKYVRPTLEQLKRRAALGIRTTGQVLNAISPSKTTLGIGAGILSLLINNPTRRLGGAI
tara:strand:+ start:34 stop:516 length:483 start_codon:yes stop_codon:yes gene_type:complete